MKVLPSNGRVIGIPDSELPLYLEDFTYPTVSSSRLWLDRNQKVYSDTAGTTPAAIDGTIASWRAVGGGWGTDLLTQSTASLRPTLKSNGIQCDGTDDKLDLPSSITLSGNWTFYVVSSRSANADAVCWASDGATNILGDFGSSEFYYFNFATAASVTDASTALSIKRYRKTGTALALKVPGVAETSQTATGNLVWSQILARSTESTSSGARFRQLVFVQKSITPDDADDLAIRAKLLLLEPGTTDLT